MTPERRDGRWTPRASDVEPDRNRSVLLKGGDMSLAHLAWLAANAYRFRGNVKDFKILLAYADRASIEDGIAFPGARDLHKTTGLSTGDCQRSRDSLIESGWLVDRGEHRNSRRFFVNFDGVDLHRRARSKRSESTAESTAESDATSTAESTAESTASPLDLAGETVSNLNLNTESEPEPSSALEWLVARAIEYDLEQKPPKNPAGDGLRRQMATFYKQTIAHALAMRSSWQAEPIEPHTDLARDLIVWAFHKREGSRPPDRSAALLVRPLPDCSICSNRRLVPDPDPNDPPEYEPRLGPCPCVKKHKENQP